MTLSVQNIRDKINHRVASINSVLFGILMICVVDPKKTATKKIPLAWNIIVLVLLSLGVLCFFLNTFFSA
jgi:hypothetical protein